MDRGGQIMVQRDLKIKFNTSPRKTEMGAVVTEFLDFTVRGILVPAPFPSFSKHSISFKVERAQAYGKLLTDNHLKKTVLTEVQIWAPEAPSLYRVRNVLNLMVSIGENSGPVQAESFTIRFQKNLLNWEAFGWNKVSVEPPLELITGRTYSVIVENLSTVDVVDGFQNHPVTYFGPRVSNMSPMEWINLEDEVRVFFKEINRKTDYYAQNLPDFSEELHLIRGVEIRLQ